MNRLLIHGCYDKSTLKTLLDLGAQRFAFDLRGRSPNLVPFIELKDLMPELLQKEVVLIFENDKDTTVFSFLDLLKEIPINYNLEFRDNRELKFYESFNCPFYWLSTPQGDWRSILHASKIKGVLLPLIYKSEFQNLPEFWSMVEAKNLEVLLHTDNFSEAGNLPNHQDISLSIDLTKEVEEGFRSVDQERLKGMKIWRKLNESVAFQ